MLRELKTGSNRKEALIARTTYYEGRSCRKCSKTKRYTANSSCVDCFNTRRAELRLLNIESERKRERESYHKHSHKRKAYSKLPEVRAVKTCRQRTRNATKLNATPKWSNLGEVALIYKHCPKGYHVDHIIPLKSKVVCGLHVPSNLAIISEFENLSKGNKFNTQHITNR